jgi:hypothetical protein
MADSLNQGGKCMWPSLKTAIWLYDFANIGLIIGLVIGVISTVLVIWMGNVKEEHLNRALANSRERTATLEKQSTELKVAVSDADARAAEANEKAEKERLERIRLEEDLAWRRLTKKEQQIIASKLANFSGQIVSLWYGAGDKEAETFAWELASSLDSAKWKVFSPASSITMASSGKLFGSVSPQETGIMVTSTGDKSSIEASQALVNELLALGFDAIKSQKIEERKGSLVIATINVRPEGPQGKAKLKNKNK